MMMTYFFWSLPALAIVLAIGSGRTTTTSAAILGLLIALPVAAGTGPAVFGIGQMYYALARGLWIGATIAPYILGGLLFWRIAAHSETQSRPAVGASRDASRLAQRRTLFFACFLVGPFAESATGFGVGMLGTVTLIRGLNLAPRHLMVFALLSQTMIPWGAMGSGTLLAAAYARIPAAELSLYAMVPVAFLMLIWMPLFWRTTRLAGWEAPTEEHLREAAWIAVALALLALATWYLGPEAALLSAYGPLIVLHYLVHERPNRQTIRATAQKSLPYLWLIGALVLTRLVPTLKVNLSNFAKLAPFADLPAWSPLLHAGTWLLAGGILTAMGRRQGHLVLQEGRAAWKTGKHAVFAVFLFAMMAEVLSTAGIAQASAAALFSALQEKALLLTPLVSSVFGVLTNSGNAPNSLFMPSQLALAVQAGLSIPAVAALQHVSGTSMSFFSPIRMSIAASLSHGSGQERHIYLVLLPYAASCLVLLLSGAAWIALVR